MESEAFSRSLLQSSSSGCIWTVSLETCTAQEFRESRARCSTAFPVTALSWPSHLHGAATRQEATVNGSSTVVEIVRASKRCVALHWQMPWCMADCKRSITPSSEWSSQTQSWNSWIYLWNHQQERLSTSTGKLMMHGIWFVLSSVILKCHVFISHK